MKKINNITFVLLVSIFFISCQSLNTSNTNTPTKKTATNISKENKKTKLTLPILVAIENNEKELLSIIDSTQTINGFVVWDCKDYVKEKETLFQVGYFEIIGKESNKQETFGFIIFEEPFIEEIYWEPGTPLPGEKFSESNLPKGKVLSPYGIAPEAMATPFYKEGLNYCWKWYNPKIENSSYEIVVKPDGTTLYYDFTNIPYGEGVKPNSVLKGNKHIVKGSMY